MFYANNKQVKGIFLNGRNYSYLSYGFGKIIPENRNAEQLCLNLAGKCLNKYRIEFGTVKAGYDNALVSPRFDKPDSNGIFHSPFTYYYGGNIVPTKNVPVYINNGYCAIRGPVYNDININGNIVNFAANSDFQGHNVNIHTENLHSDSPYSCISNCRNIKLNITGSYWQAWVHPNCHSSNCNITTRNIVPGFDYMNYCNFNIYLPSTANADYSLLSNARNCNYNLNALGSNLYDYRVTAFFDNLNNCNLNLLVNNAVKFSDGFGGHFNNCNIVFDNIKGDLLTRNGWYNLYNCNITGNVESKSSAQGFLERCDGININLNCAKSSRILPICRCNNVNGNIVVGNFAIIEHCNRISLFNVNNGNITFNNIEHGSFPRVYNSMVTFTNVNNSNATCSSRSYISALNNCHNISLYGFNTAGEVPLENVYDSSLVFNYGTGIRFMTKRVSNCNITGFPYSASYTENCIFDVGFDEAKAKNNSYITWVNVWPHGSRAYSGQYRYLAGLKSVDNSISRCSIASDEMVFGENVNHMTTSLNTFYNTVTANLPNYNMNVRFKVDCNTLNLGIFQSSPPHGFENSSISADNIYCTTGNNYYVQLNNGTRVYCENFCNVAFSPVSRKFSDNYQPVLLINNYRHSNSQAHNFNGGICRIGRLS